MDTDLGVCQSSRDQLQLSRDRSRQVRLLSHRATKPSPTGYAAAPAVLGAAPAHVLFVDDSGVHIDGVCRMGIATVHFTSAESLRSELARAGLLV
jgi:HAD superfamily hydrolase (TIGR01509 family)